MTISKAEFVSRITTEMRKRKLVGRREANRAICDHIDAQKRKAGRYYR